MTRETSLSLRETEIAGLYAGGATYKAIAIQLFIAPSTVRSHIAAIYLKLDLSSKLALKARLDADFVLAHPENNQDAVIAELSLVLEESILREKMLSTVLRIIELSKGDTDTVLSSIMEHALMLCKAKFGMFMEHRGNNSTCVRHSNFVPKAFQDWLSDTGEISASEQSQFPCFSKQKAILNIVDIRTHNFTEADDPLHHATETLGRARSVMVIPMLTDGIVIGAFTAYRQEVHPFTQESMNLAAIFIDQSGVAIGNARMMSALREDT